MTSVNRDPAEQEQTRLARLERIVADLQRAGAGLVAMHAQASGALGPTPIALTDVPGASLVVTRPGRYMMIAVFDWQWQVAGTVGISTAVGTITCTGATNQTTAQALLEGDARARITVPVVQFAQFAGAGTARLQAQNTTAPTGTLATFNQHSTLTLIRTGAS